MWAATMLALAMLAVVARATATLHVANAAEMDPVVLVDVAEAVLVGVVVARQGVAARLVVLLGARVVAAQVAVTAALRAVVAARLALLLGARVVAAQVAVTAALTAAEYVAQQAAPAVMALVAVVAVAVPVVWALGTIEALAAAVVAVHQAPLAVASPVGM